MIIATFQLPAAGSGCFTAEGETAVSQGWTLSMARFPILYRQFGQLRFLALFLSLLLLLLAAPFLLADRHEGYLNFLFFVVMLSGVGIASQRRRHRWIGLGFGLAWLIMSISRFALQAPELRIVTTGLFIIFNVYVLVIVLRTVVAAAKVDGSILLGAASAYLMIGIIWAATYMMIYELDQGAFSLVHEGQEVDFHHFLYFSLTTLTTTGYGDITPLKPFAQIWAALEAVVATLYMALLVARLVSMYQGRDGQRQQ